jgi:hypothetical protein
MDRVTRYLRQNAIALVALFIALSAGAYAAGLPKNSVKSKQIKDGAVTTRDLKDGAVVDSKIADGAVNGGDVADGSIDAADLTPSVLSRLADGCPAGMTKVGDLICIDTQRRGAATDWGTAATTCANAQLRLPLPTEALAAAKAGVGGGTARFWTEIVTGSANNAGTNTVTAYDENFSAFRSTVPTTQYDTYCAVPPSAG